MRISGGVVSEYDYKGVCFCCCCVAWGAERQRGVGGKAPTLRHFVVLGGDYIYNICDIYDTIKVKKSMQI